MTKSMKKKAFVITIGVELKYDEEKIKDVLKNYKEFICEAATLESLLEDIAANIAMGNFYIDGIGQLVPCVEEEPDSDIICVDYVDIINVFVDEFNDLPF